MLCNIWVKCKILCCQRQQNERAEERGRNRFYSSDKWNVCMSPHLNLTNILTYATHSELYQLLLEMNHWYFSIISHSHSHSHIPCHITLHYTCIWISGPWDAEYIPFNSFFLLTAIFNVVPYLPAVVSFFWSVCGEHAFGATKKQQTEDGWTKNEEEREKNENKANREQNDKTYWLAANFRDWSSNSNSRLGFRRENL